METYKEEYEVTFNWKKRCGDWVCSDKAIVRVETRLESLKNNHQAAARKWEKIFPYPIKVTSVGYI